MVEDYAVTSFFSHAKKDKFYCGSSCRLAALGNDNPMCPQVVYQAFFEKMGITKLDNELLNCRITSRKDTQIPKPLEMLTYTTSVENSKRFLAKFRLEGRFSEKLFKVSEVNGAFKQGITMEDAM